MEATKKEYINKLKRELDLIETRYQHLLNENSMQGEDFRSRALMNLEFSQRLEQKIERLNEEIRVLNGIIDKKDLNIDDWQRQGEEYQMWYEEMHMFAQLRGEKIDRTQAFADDLTAQLEEKSRIISMLEEQIRQIELQALNGKVDVPCQTTIDYKYWQRKSESIDTKRGSYQSGNISSAHRTTGQRIGGGGIISKKPLSNRRDSKVGGMSSARSGVGLQIDTRSSHSHVGTNQHSPNGKRYGNSNRSKDGSNRSPRGSDTRNSDNRSPRARLPGQTNSMKKLGIEDPMVNKTIDSHSEASPILSNTHSQ